MLESKIATQIFFNISMHVKCFHLIPNYDLLVNSFIDIPIYVKCFQLSWDYKLLIKSLIWVSYLRFNYLIIIGEKNDRMIFKSHSN